MMTKSISIGLLKLHCLRVAERARGGSKIYFGGSMRADGYCLLSGEECIRIDGVIWSSDWKEYLTDALQDVEAMLSLGYAAYARSAVEMLDGRSFADWLDSLDWSDCNGDDWQDIPTLPESVVEPLVDRLFASGVSGLICDAMLNALLGSSVPSRGDLVQATGCTDWKARKAIERLEEVAIDYAADYRIDRLVCEIVSELE